MPQDGNGSRHRDFLGTVNLFTARVGNLLHRLSFRLEYNDDSHMPQLAVEGFIDMSIGDVFGLIEGGRVFFCHGTGLCRTPLYIWLYIN